jgi:hypothetical protein
MAKKFEYKTIVIEPKGFWNSKYDTNEIDQELNNLGMIGWELVAVESKDFGGMMYGFHYTFKREL